MWSYPDPDDEKKEGMSDPGGGSEADEAAFSLAMNDEVRFRVRTLEFTEVRLKGPAGRVLGGCPHGQRAFQR